MAADNLSITSFVYQKMSILQVLNALRNIIEVT